MANRLVSHVGDVDAGRATRFARFRIARVSHSARQTVHSSRQMTERAVQVFSKHDCGLPSLRDFSSPETALRPLLEELVTLHEHQITSTRKLVVYLSENNFTLDHLQYLAEWLAEKGLN